MFTPAALTWSRCTLRTTSAKCIAVTRGSHRTALRFLREALSWSYPEGVGRRLRGLLSLSPSVQPVPGIAMAITRYQWRSRRLNDEQASHRLFVQTHTVKSWLHAGRECLDDWT